VKPAINDDDDDDVSFSYLVVWTPDTAAGFATAQHCRHDVTAEANTTHDTI